MKQSYSIWIVSPEGYIHSRCFEEVAIALQSAFGTLGYKVPIVNDPDKIQGIAITLGCNLLPMLGKPIPSSLILYNLEQVIEQSNWLNTSYIAFLKHFPLWDYSTHNIEALKKLGITHAKLCGIGYMPELTRISKAEQDIDVLFIGSMNQRRQDILEAISNHHKHVVISSSAYGMERDGLIARAKIVINLHYYEAQIFEIVRVSYLLANRVCVLSETGFDYTLESPLREGIAFEPYDQLVTRCIDLLEDEKQRQMIAEKGFECFSKLSQIDMLKAALASA